jgi:hypothetical protein
VNGDRWNRCAAIDPYKAAAGQTQQSAIRPGPDGAVRVLRERTDKGNSSRPLPGIGQKGWGRDASTVAGNSVAEIG